MPLHASRSVEDELCNELLDLSLRLLGKADDACQRRARLLHFPRRPIGSRWTPAERCIELVRPRVSRSEISLRRWASTMKPVNKANLVTCGHWRGNGRRKSIQHAPCSNGVCGNELQLQGGSADGRPSTSGRRVRRSWCRPNTSELHRDRVLRCHWLRRSRSGTAPLSHPCEHVSVLSREIGQGRTRVRCSRESWHPPRGPERASPFGVL